MIATRAASSKRRDWRIGPNDADMIARKSDIRTRGFLTNSDRGLHLGNVGSTTLTIYSRRAQFQRLGQAQRRGADGPRIGENRVIRRPTYGHVMNAIRLCRPWALPLALMLGSLVGWGALALVAWGQALPDGEQDAPEIAYDSTQNCFFAVYEEVAGGIGGISAAGASFSEAGTAVGNGFTVADETVDRSTPSVAFDPTTGKFLVVWTETSAVWGQLVTGATAATGPVIGVNTTGGNPATLDVAANSVSGGGTWSPGCWTPS